MNGQPRESEQTLKWGLKFAMLKACARRVMSIAAGHEHCKGNCMCVQVKLTSVKVDFSASCSIG